MKTFKDCCEEMIARYIDVENGISRENAIDMALEIKEEIISGMKRDLALKEEALKRFVDYFAHERMMNQHQRLSNFHKRKFESLGAEKIDEDDLDQQDLDFMRL